jgi:hypothetical protein
MQLHRVPPVPSEVALVGHSGACSSGYKADAPGEGEEAEEDCCVSGGVEVVALHEAADGLPLNVREEPAPMTVRGQRRRNQRISSFSESREPHSQIKIERQQPPNAPPLPFLCP